MHQSKILDFIYNPWDCICEEPETLNVLPVSLLQKFTLFWEKACENIYKFQSLIENFVSIRSEEDSCKDSNHQGAIDAAWSGQCPSSSLIWEATFWMGSESKGLTCKVHKMTQKTNYLSTILESSSVNSEGSRILSTSLAARYPDSMAPEKLGSLNETKLNF
jgi:hypothetical protein